MFSIIWEFIINILESSLFAIIANASFQKREYKNSILKQFAFLSFKSIFITILIAINELKGYWWIGFGIAVVGMIMDTYYLAFERMYRKRYNNFVKKLNDGQIDEKEIYNMNPKNTDLKYEVFAVMLEAVKSFSVIGFYILFICITILLKFI